MANVYILCASHKIKKFFRPWKSEILNIEYSSDAGDLYNTMVSMYFDASLRLQKKRRKIKHCTVPQLNSSDVQNGTVAEGCLISRREEFSFVLICVNPDDDPEVVIKTPAASITVNPGSHFTVAKKPASSQTGSIKKVSENTAELKFSELKTESQKAEKSVGKQIASASRPIPETHR